MSLTLSVTECMSSLDIYVSLKPEAIKILKLCVFLIGVAPPGFQPGLAVWKNSLSRIPPTFPFTVCKPWPSARGMVLVALTAEYQECLKAGPFDVHYQCVSAWWHCNCSTRMRCVDTFCWHLRPQCPITRTHLRQRETESYNILNCSNNKTIYGNGLFCHNKWVAKRQGHRNLEFHIVHLLEPAPKTQTATAHLQTTWTVYFDGQGTQKLPCGIGWLMVYKAKRVQAGAEQ